MSTPTHACPMDPIPLHVFAVEAPESLQAAHRAAFSVPLIFTPHGWRRRDATWWRKKPNAFARVNLNTTQAWLRHWARSHLTETHWRNLTKRESLIDVHLLAVWDGGAIGRITPHSLAPTDRLWKACMGLVPTPDAPIGVALLDRPPPHTAHEHMAALHAIPDWAWHGPMGTFLTPPQPSWASTAQLRRGPRPAY